MLFMPFSIDCAIEILNDLTGKRRLVNVLIWQQVASPFNILLLVLNFI